MAQNRGGGLQVDSEQQSSPQQINRHLLVMGVNAYKDSAISTLNNAEADAQRFAGILQSQYGFSAALTQELYGEQAKKEAVDQAIKNTLAKATKQDDVVIYFAGHGHYDPVKEAGFWLLYDAVDGDTSSYLRNSDLKTYIKNSKARHVFGIIDSCFSGAMFVQRSLSPTAQRLYSLPSRWLMTSGLVEPVSDGKAGEHSPFARSLFAALEANATDALGVTQLWQLMRDGVFANARQTPRCEPLQSANHMGGELYFMQDGAAAPQRILKLPDNSPAVYTDARGNEFSLELSKLEQAGMQSQAKLLMRKLQKMQEALILETDPARQFAYEEIIRRDQEKLDDLQARL